MSESEQANQRELQWYIVGRRQEYEGEARANLLRVIAVACFYGVQFYHYFLISDRSTSASDYHRAVTLVAAGWLFLSLAVLIALQRRFFPAGLKYAVALSDLLLLTAVCSLGSGALSPLVAGYFIVIAMGALRFSVSLIWTSTLGAMAGYMTLVALKDPSWFNSEHTTPVVNQLILMLSLGLTGIVLGQVIRRVHWMATLYTERIAALRPEGSES